MASTGEKNNNHFNTKKPGGDEYLGCIGYDDRGHCIFDDLLFGYRAAICNVRQYLLKGHNTPITFFSVYADSGDTQGSIAGNPANDPEEYAEYVAKLLEIGIDDKLDFFFKSGIVKDKSGLTKFLRAIFKFENGKLFMLPVDALDKFIHDGIMFYYCFLKLA